MLTNYLKIALKVLMRRKFYTAVNLLGIAFTLLVMILVVALMDNFLAPGAPESRLDRILAIDQAMSSGPHSMSTGNPGYRLLDTYARDLPGAEKLAISTVGRSVASYLEGEKITLEMRRTDGAFWEILDFTFIEGGPYTQADDDAGNFAAVITESTRKRFFGGPPALGKTLRVDGQAFTVVGVVRDVSVTRNVAYAEIYVPLGTSKSTTYQEALRGDFEGIILAETRDAFPAIRSEFARRLEKAQLPDPDRYDTLDALALTRFEKVAMEFGTSNMPQRDENGIARMEYPRTGQFVAWIVLLAAGFMLLPALNLVNLSLSRILERASEIGVRKAFGASSATLVGQFLVENVVLTLVGGGIGILLSWVALQVINASGFIPYAELTMSIRTIIAGLGLSLAFAMMAGSLPAWRMSRLHPVEALHGRVR